MSNILSLNKVSRSYSVREKVINVFSDLDIFIEKGEKVAIIGPSGSGKTSILNIAGLIERPNSGSVSINDYEVNWTLDKEISDLRKKNMQQLDAELISARESQFGLRIKHKTGQLNETSELMKVRKKIAQIKTIMNEIKHKGEE